MAKPPFPSRWIEDPVRTTTTPFIYKIEVGSKLYVGMKIQKGCHPDDLMVSYFTSSPTVWNAIKEGHIPKVLKIKVCRDEQHALELERRYLKRYLPTRRKLYLNQMIPRAGRIFIETMTEAEMMRELAVEAQRVAEQQRIEAQRLAEQQRAREAELVPQKITRQNRTLVSPEARRAAFRLVGQRGSTNGGVKGVQGVNFWPRFTKIFTNTPRNTPRNAPEPNTR